MKRILYLASILAFLLALAIGYNSGKAFACGGADGDGCLMKSAHAQAVTVAATEEVTDPVCGMVIKKDPKKSIEHEGYTYYFCSENCMEKFKGDTQKYACPCIDIKPGCNCYHCTGRGKCECLKEMERERKHKHEHEGGEEYHH